MDAKTSVKYMESRKCYWWTYLQGSTGDADREKRLMEMREGESGMNGDSCMEMHTLPYVKKVSQWEFIFMPLGTQTGAL